MTFASSAMTRRSGVMIERVDLDERRVLARVGGVERGEHVADRAHDVGVDARLERQPPAVEGLKADERVDVQRRQRLRALGGDLLDVHAALRGEHHERRLRRAVEDDGGVVLAGDVGRLLDPQLVHGVAADVHPEDRRGVLAHRVGVVGELDPAGLAAAADLHLRLDDDRVADHLRPRRRPRRRCEPARRPASGTS